MNIDAAGIRFADWAPTLTGGQYAEAYLEQSKGKSIVFEDSQVTEISSGEDHGVGLRYLERGPTGAVETIHGSINSLDPHATCRLANDLLAGRKRRDAPQSRQPDVYRQNVRIRPESAPMNSNFRLLEQLDRTIRTEFPHIRQVHISYSERDRRVAILDSDGGFKIGERATMALILSVTAEKDGVLQSGFEVISGLKGREILDDYNPVRAARRAAQSAVDKLSAPVAMAGEMPIILAASAGGTFVHEAIGHSLEADHVQEGTSPHYAGMLGKIVAREFLTIVDDPSLPFARGSFPFDDEGLPSKATTLIKDGKLVDYLYDRTTAMRENRLSNGHGRRESFRSKPIPRMSNLYIAPGKEDPAEILKSLDRGLLVTQMGGGEVNTATGEFVFGVDEGYWVEGGKIKHRVRDANMLGVGPDVLKSIDRLGWDIGWGVGTCGKQGQGVPVSDGQPTLRIPSLLIGGRDE
ncbi:MAG: peptidase C69 [Elusimicrobia bacterium]|nr:MAG: peptidase C69 [Elusimicrobiota bacterium]